MDAKGCCYPIFFPNFVVWLFLVFLLFLLLIWCFCGIPFIP